ncbi:MAG: RNA polymerase factor sigma-54 [Thermodesulfobacteriota bacterium]|nr:RNA polymerase factor sigma-54 [Thermodesulfobacteriota bacterium]
MALEIKQVPKLTQQTIMTPQLQQSIKLLQLSRLELTNLIQREIIENPVLEEAQDFHEGEDILEIDNVKDNQYDNPSEQELDKREDIDLGANWDSYIEGNISEGYSRTVEKEDGLSLENRLTKEASLSDHLMWQLRLSNFSKNEELIGALIIGNIDEDGYLRTTLADIAEMGGMDESLVSDVLRRIQEFDPIGIGARDLKECLLIQAKHFIKDNPFVEEILNNHLHELENRNFQIIAKKLGVSLDEVLNAASLISELDPKPGSYLSKEEPKYITPDIYVYKVGDDFFIVLNEDGMPKLKINSFYRDALSQKDVTSKVTKEYIQGKIRSAVWLIKSVHQRQRTIYKVMESIIKFQHDFFEKGTGALKPLSLKIIARDIGMHESTVSRVTTHKYVHTPQGIFELKYFFNSGINCSIGESIASESVKDKIKQIVLNENAKKPYSDKKIMEILEEHNISIARRTVTKYREMLNILPSSKRKKIF